MLKKKVTFLLILGILGTGANAEIIKCEIDGKKVNFQEKIKDQKNLRGLELKTKISKNSYHLFIEIINLDTKESETQEEFEIKNGIVYSMLDEKKFFCENEK